MVSEVLSALTLCQPAVNTGLFYSPFLGNPVSGQILHNWQQGEKCSEENQAGKWKRVTGWVGGAFWKGPSWPLNLDFNCGGAEHSGGEDGGTGLSAMR